MAVLPVLPVVLVIFLLKCHCEPINGYNYNNDVSQFEEILKPPPPPPSSILPVPFHGGSGRIRHNNDNGYKYKQPPPIPPALPISQSTEFKFPAPFYKQYNFNFVPPPQPFSTTPSPSLFQKVSGWLFPSQPETSNTGSDVSYNVPAPLKKDCNPCNLVPWIPVIRYDLASNNLRQNINPTYGPPSPTIANNFNAGKNVAQRFNSQNSAHKTNQISPGIPHSVYGPPSSNSNNDQIRFQSSTYGPPSPTHTVAISNEPLNFRYEGQNSSPIPSSTYRLPSSSYSVHNSPAPLYNTPSINYNNHFVSTTHNPLSNNYKPDIINQYLPSQNDVHDLEPSSELRLPKVSHPVGFKNSYGEPIINTYALDIPYSVSAPAASTKINTQVLPDKNENKTLALANPAPFSLNRGRNIHTLQPVALPNLSVSPLPPIFNARPFRNFPTNYPTNIVQSINYLQSQSNKVDIAKSVPIAEYTHSINYPTTIIQSPVIDIDEIKRANQSKAYRNIVHSYEIDEIPQASEDHIAATKTNHDASFESISTGLTNDLYDNGIPLDFKQSPNAPFNHKANFADLRGVKDEDVDKYRTESNLQHIDSPLLYLKPNAPHKNYKSFISVTTTPETQNEYEIYDEYIPTTLSPIQTKTNNNEEVKTKNNDEWSHNIVEEENQNRPKIVQIIVPYTTGQRIDTNKNSFSPSQEDMNTANAEQEYKARKIESQTENNYYSLMSEGTTSLMTTTEELMSTVTEQYESARLNTPAILNDLFDVQEPPFDIIKLQHTIDDWTEQEYSKYYHIPQRTRSNEKYAKQIPDEYLTTISPITNYMTEANYNIDLYDHEGSSSIQHSVTENRTNNLPVNRKEYNTIERIKSENSGKNEESEIKKKLHIYTAASTFRSTTTTTSAPWGHIQTSISPLTNEKVYVVTSKPWKESNETDSNKPEYDYEDNEFTSNRTIIEDSAELEDLPFKSPRFSNRPSYGFTADAMEHTKVDSPYGYSKGWHRRINNLGNGAFLSNGNIYYEEEKESKTP